HQEGADIQLAPKSEEELPVSAEPQDAMDLEALLEQDPPKPVDPSEQGQGEDPAPLADLQVISTGTEPEQETEESADKDNELPQEVPVNAAMTATPYIPALDAPEKTPAEEQEEEAAQQTVEELVPGAKTEQPDSIITEEDLREAFAEHSNQNNSQSVEQLFGLASATASANALAEKDMPSTDEQENMPSLSEISSDTPAEKAMPEGDPEKVTDEIELKEGSTYLISDFVPPASSSAMRQAYEAKENPDKAAEDAAREANAGKDEPLEIQEMVTEPQGDLPQVQENNVSPLPDAETTPETTEGNISSELTVSQIVLENTIKAKRGASLDIKTVPMVPDPAKSERLQLEDINDINTQHDLKSADIQPAGRTAKLVVGTLIALLLAAVIYAMLGVMDLIPAKFNIFNSQATAETEQQAQLNEVLPIAQPEESTMNALPGNLPTVTVEDTTAPADATLPPTTQDAVLSEVQNYRLANGYTLKQYIEKKHPAMVDLITWSISNAVDPDNYSVLAKVPPENPQSFKISYRFNYNAVTKTLEPTISDARNLLESVNQPAGR
ncbi:MAG: hypothetical protein MJ053_06890, partial [Elusimicrobiaceae bacterium]|nr:hypothetical protein [Elusimicrobiaceae bacterium]